MIWRPGGGQHGAQFVVLQRGGAAHLHTAHRIDHLREAGEIDRHEPVDGQARQLLDHLHQALRSSEGIGRVQLGFRVHLFGAIALRLLVPDRSILAGLGIPRLTLDRRDREVTRKRHDDDAFAVGRDVYQHHGVRPGAAGDLGVARAHIAVLAEAAVHADDEEVLVAELRVRVEDVARTRVQRGHPVEHVVLRRLPLPRPAGQRQRQHGDHRRKGPAGEHHPAAAMVRFERWWATTVADA